MATTTNYGWTTPDDTALVKDGASAIRTLGSSVDTTTKNLNPSTTLGDIEYRSSTANTNTRLGIGSSGQVLTVAAGVPSWATPTDQTPLTTKGDLFTFSTVDARVGVGANGTVLTADSAEATGLKWATPAAGGYTLITDVALSSSTGYSFSSIPNTYKHLVLTWTGLVISAISSEFSLRFNADSASNYEQQSLYNETGSSPVLAGVQGTKAGPEMFGVHTTGTGNYTTARGSIIIYDYASTSRYKFYDANYSWYSNNNSRYNFFNVYGSYYSLLAISSLDITRISGTANITNQTNTSVRLYGVS